VIRPGFLSASDRRELVACVRSHREDHGVARRANAILLLDDGKSCQVIAEFLYLDDDTIRGWYKTYREAGWDALSTDGWKGGQSRMTSAQEAELCGWLDGRFCRSTVEIMARIAAQFGLDYSHSGCIKLLSRLGYEYRKPKGLPRVAPAEQQAGFIDEYERLLNDLGTDEAVYFADAVHPEYQTKPAFGWVKAGSKPAVQTTAGVGASTFMAHSILRPLTFPLSSRPPWMDAVLCSFWPKSRPETPTSVSSMSSGTTPPTTKGRTFGSSSQDRRVGSI
jgi:transposase